MDIIESLEYILNELIVHITNSISGLDYVAPKHAKCANAIVTFAIIYAGNDIHNNILVFLHDNGDFAVSKAQDTHVLTNIADPAAFTKITDYIHSNLISI